VGWGSPILAYGHVKRNGDADEVADGLLSLLG
jgi:hypothetical protein